MRPAPDRPILRLDPTPRTVGQKWRRKRNLVIACAHEAGFSQRWLAEVFDLPRSSIASIVKDLEAEAARKIARATDSRSLWRDRVHAGSRGPARRHLRDTDQDEATRDLD